MLLEHSLGFYPTPIPLNFSCWCLSRMDFRCKGLAVLIFFFSFVCKAAIVREKVSLLQLAITRWLQLLSLWIKSYGVTIQMKATEQYFPVVLFVMLYKVVQDFESVDEILWCDHLNKSY